jgi:hypothetical protein
MNLAGRQALERLGKKGTLEATWIQSIPAIFGQVTLQSGTGTPERIDVVLTRPKDAWLLKCMGNWHTDLGHYEEA